MKRVRTRDGKGPFHEFMDRLDGGWYKAWRRHWRKGNGVDLDDVLRNGLARHYVPKIAARLYFNFNQPLGGRRFGPDDESPPATRMGTGSSHGRNEVTREHVVT